jgi:hypothetical protein
MPGSGSRWFAKADLKSKSHLTEVKATATKSYTLSLKTLEKIEREALAADREPQLIVEFSTPQGRKMYKVERFYGE